MNAMIKDKLLLGYLVKASNGEDIVWVPTPWLDNSEEHELVVPAKLLDADGFLSQELADESRAIFDKMQDVIHQVIYLARKEIDAVDTLGLSWEDYARIVRECITDEEDAAGDYDADALVARVIRQLQQIKEADQHLALT